mgnify:CR=1 FL=1
MSILVNLNIKINNIDINIDNDWLDILLENVVGCKGFTYILNDIRISCNFVDQFQYIDCMEKKIIGLNLHQYLEKNLIRFL